MFDDSAREWLDARAEQLDRGDCDPDTIVPWLAQAGLFRVGVPRALGGDGASTIDAVLQIATVAQHSLNAAFMFWGQRAFIEYVLHSPNLALREQLLEPLLAGRLAGATGLSNAMKFLSGIEGLQVAARAEGSDFRLDGKLAWVTNLRKRGYVVACAVDHGAARGPSIFAIPHDAEGLSRSADLDLIGLRSSDTAALTLRDIKLGAHWQLHADGTHFLRTVRPAFLSMQCGLAIGVAQSSLSHARAACGTMRGELPSSLAKLERQLRAAVQELSAGLEQELYQRTPIPLFELRIRLVELALAAVTHELQAAGGKAYVRGATDGFARRWNEAAFLPIVTPSCVQLRSELERHHAQRENRESA